MSSLFSNIWDDEDELEQEGRDQLVEYCGQYATGFTEFFKKAAYGSFTDFFANGETFMESGVVNSETGLLYSQEEKKNFVITLRKYIKKTFSLEEIQAMFPNQNPGQASKPITLAQTNTNPTNAIAVTGTLNGVPSMPIIIAVDPAYNGGDNSSHGSASTSGVEDYSSTIQMARAEDLCGDSLYWVNPKTKHQKAIINGKFSAINLDLDIDSKDPVKKWKITPMEVIEECRAARKLEATFPNYFNAFSLEIFKRIGDVFPYEIPNPAAYQMAALFCGQFRELDHFYQQYRKVYPSTKLNECQDTVELLKVKLKNKFKYRGVGLKEDSLWPYRPHEKRKFEGMKVLSKQKKVAKMKRKAKETEGIDATEKQVLKKMRNNFNYSGIKVLLEKKMEELEIIRESKKAVKPLGSDGVDVEVVIPTSSNSTSTSVVAHQSNQHSDQQQQVTLAWPIEAHQDVHQHQQFSLVNGQYVAYQNYAVTTTDVVSPNNDHRPHTRRTSSRQAATNSHRFTFPSTEYSSH